MDTLLRYGLLAVFVALVLTSFGFPVPEDVSLLGAGVLVHMGHATLMQALVVGYCGVLAGDLIAFHWGRKIGMHPTGKLSKLVGPNDIAWIARFYDRWGSGAILIARQFPGMRLPAFFFAGASGVRLSRFILVDGLGACITVGLFVSLGRHFADDLAGIVTWLERARLVGVATFSLFAGVLIWRILRRRLRRRSISKAWEKN